jgi:transmembrane sensor
LEEYPFYLLWLSLVYRVMLKGYKMTDQEVKDLLEKYKQGKCTAEEELQIHSWQNDLDASSPDVVPGEEYAAIKAATYDKLFGEKARSKIGYWRVAAAVAVLFATGIAYFLYQAPVKQDLYTYNKTHDIPAGGNKATLTLANGQQINLDNAKAGTLAKQGGVTVSKNQNGQIVYNVSSGDSVSSQSSTTYNTISTPNGGQYQIILPDGSHVWLNAASSLKYPTAFNAGVRKVQLKGEAYFEITKNPGKPFIVDATNHTVKVLGTHFNMNTYADGPARTTLVEGQVLVSLPSNDHQILKPGQQAIITGNVIQIKEVNVEDEIAWKDGLLVFQNATTKNVLQHICRWYDVSVDYTTLPEKHFDGEIPMDRPLSEVLKVLEKTNHVKFRIEERKITIQK